MPWYITSILMAVSLSMDAFAVSLSNGLTNKKMPVRYMIITALSFGIFQGVMPLIGYLLGSIFEEWIEVALPIIGFAVLSFLGIKMIVDSAKEIKEEKKAKLALMEVGEAEAEGDVNSENVTADSDLTVATADDEKDNADFAFTTDEMIDGDDGAVECLASQSDSEAITIEEDKPYKFSWKMLLIQSVATSIDALTVGLVYIGKQAVEVYVTFALIAVITFGICVWGVFFGKKFGEKLKNKAGIFGGVILIALALKTIIEFLIEKFA